MNVTLLATLGGVIILALAFYAGYLLLQLKKQNELQLQHQKIAIEKRNANIFESVNILCLAGIQGQCDLSEISIRVYNIMDYVQGSDRVEFDKEFPATSELFHIVKVMPRGEERQKLAKRERMKQNLERQKAESRLEQAIISELKILQKKVQPLNNQITVQMI
ncbi:DUF2489 domain-containing protein [Vibrio ostreicida]|uniref:DUF2489 domain-containing protein n=1 Tax=Vibrio ostreicida TaxID=526588 RepID=A0ABT8BP88_9VIBR|nr:DUF2489 domain-containing protein [Vibrio ostreicida]MDN3608701.1 DUF2489 domain-containing protein [Vibrio ostreicida]NPD10616.1 DUF2489 domain-containing protein [Vibrio ostreicida]